MSNNSIGEISFVNGKTIEQFLCIQSQDEDTKEFHPGIFWLKTTEENHWNRFFLDAWIAFWEIYPIIDEDDFDNPGKYPSYNIGEDFGLIGSQVQSIVAQDDTWQGKPAVALRIKFSSGQELVIWDNEEHSAMQI